MKVLTCLIALLVSTGGTLAAAAEQSARPNNYEQYSVIYERNVFSKDRFRPQERTQRTSVRTTTTVLSIYALRGIAAETGRNQRVAFVEEQISGLSQTATAGTPILNGRITGIHMDYVLFTEDGVTRQIKVGQEFGQTRSTVTTEVAAPADANAAADESPPEAETPAAPQPAGEEDLLKKLMERRQQQLGT